MLFEDGRTRLGTTHPLGISLRVDADLLLEGVAVESFLQKEAAQGSSSVFLAIGQRSKAKSAHRSSSEVKDDLEYLLDLTQERVLQRDQ